MTAERGANGTPGYHICDAVLERQRPQLVVVSSPGRGQPARRTRAPGNANVSPAVMVIRKVERTPRKGAHPQLPRTSTTLQHTEERPTPWLERSVSTSAPPTPSSPFSRA